MRIDQVEKQLTNAIVDSQRQRQRITHWHVV